MAGVHSVPGANGLLWYADIYMDGRTKQVPLIKEDPKTQKKLRPKDITEARRWAKRLENSLGKQAAQRATVKRYARFNTLWPKFMAVWPTEKQWHTNTRLDYERAFRKHLSSPGGKKAVLRGQSAHGCPFLQQQVRNIDHNDIKAYLQLKLSEGLAPTRSITIRGCSPSSSTMRSARATGWVLRNPARTIRASRSPAPSRQSISRSLGALCAPAGELPPQVRGQVCRSYDYPAAYGFALVRGPRSLLWSQVSLDPKHPHLNITTTAVGLDIQDITKTPAGGRWVGLPPVLVAMLKKWAKDASA